MKVLDLRSCWSNGRLNKRTVCLCNSGMQYCKSGHNKVTVCNTNIESM